MSAAQQPEQPVLQPQHEKIFVLTAFGKTLLRRLIAFLLILFAVTVLLLNYQVLTESPFAMEMHWTRPVFACANVNGNLIVVDKGGERIIVLNPSGKIRSIIRTNPLLKHAINNVWDVCADDRNVYVLDQKLSPNGTQINEERILVYDFDGKYVDTVYETFHPESTSRYNVLCDVNCNNGKIYVTKRENDTVSVCQIVNHELQEVRKLTFPGKEIFRACFSPASHSTFVITRDACYYLDYLNKTQEVDVPAKDIYWNDAAVSSSGTHYFLDSNRHNIVQVRLNAQESSSLFRSVEDEVKTLTDCGGLNFYLTDDVLTWVDMGTNQVVSFNTATGEQKVLQGAPRPVSFLFSQAVVWLCALFLFGLILWQLIRIVKGIVQYIRHQKTREAEAGAAWVREVHTIWNFYGNNAFVLLFAFVAMTLVISLFYANVKEKSLEASVRAKAAEISDLPGNVFGDYLAKIQSARNYDSNELKTMKGVVNSVCFSSEGAEFDFAFSMLRRFPDGRFMVVTDSHEVFNFGRIIQEDDPALSGVYERLSQVQVGKPLIKDYILEKGDSPYTVYSAVTDSDGNNVGVILVSSNREKSSFETRQMIIKLSMDLLMLFTIFVLLAGEMKLFREFWKRRKVDPASGKLLQTVCEGHRTCKFLTAMSLYLDVAFLPTLFIELASHAGLKGSASVLAAVPLTLRSLLLVITLVFGSFLAKFNPGRFMKSAALGTIFCFLFELCAVVTGQYGWLLLGIGIMGITHGMKLTAAGAIGDSGLRPDPSFKNLVFANTESMIGAIVGTSLGSLMCAKFGYTSVFVLGVVLEITLFCVVQAFIGQDVNYGKLSPTSQVLHKTFQDQFSSFKKNLRYALRPEVLALLFCAMIPIRILSQFSSYVLPVYNAWAGYPQQVTGFIGTVIQLLSLLLIPYVFNKLMSRGNRLPILTGLFLVSVSLFFFAYDDSLLVLCLVLLCITVFNTVIDSTAGRLRSAVAAKDKIKYTDISGLFQGMEYIGVTVAPLLMGYCLNSGLQSFAVIFGGATALLLIVFLFASKRLRHP